METRNILDYQGNIIGSLTLPENTPEEVWQNKLKQYNQLPKSEELRNLEWEKIKEKRKKLFQETEWIKFRHRDQKERGLATSLSEEQYQQWLDYWQALRDIPEAYQDCYSVIFPDKPSTL